MSTAILYPKTKDVPEKCENQFFGISPITVGSKNAMQAMGLPRDSVSFFEPIVATKTSANILVYAWQPNGLISIFKLPLDSSQIDWIAFNYTEISKKTLSKNISKAELLDFITGKEFEA